MTRIGLSLVVPVLLVVGGCAQLAQPTTEQEPPPEEEAAEERAAEEAAAEEAERARVNTAENCPPECDFRRAAIDDPSSLLADRTIYFEFDSSRIQDRFMDLIRRHAAYLAQYPDVEVRLEGHTDERGSREYNVGLGSRRAESVGRMLQAYGVGDTQIDAISYGEEIPAVEGHNEDAWAKNRRVELVYPATDTASEQESE